MGAGGGAFVIALASVLSYLFGFVRNLMLFHYFGASLNTDSYYTAFLIPDFILNLFIAGAVSGVLMPVFVDTTKKSKEDSEKLMNAFISIMNTIVIAVAIIAFFLAPFLIKSIFVQLEPAQQELTIKLMRILLLSPVLFGVSNSLGSILIAKKKFLSFALSPILYNTGILLGIYFLAEKYGIFALAWGAVFGAFLHMSLRVVDFFTTNLSLRPSFDFNAPNFKKVIILAIPKTIGLLAFQGMLWSVNWLGGLMEAGSIAAFNLARDLQSFAVSIFGIALATGVFPFLAEFAAEKNDEKFINRTEKSARQILFLAMPSAFGLFVLSKELIELFFVHGEFDQHDAFLANSVLLLMALAIPLESLNHLFARAFLARKNTLFPMFGQIIFFLSFSVGSFLFYQELGVATFGIMFLGAIFLQLFFLITSLSLHEIKFPFLRFMRKVLPILCLSFLMMICVYFIKNISYFSSEINFVLSVAGGVFVYFFGAFLLKLPELDRVFIYLENKFKKK